MPSREFDDLLAHVGMKILDQRPAQRLPNGQTILGALAIDRSLDLKQCVGPMRSRCGVIQPGASSREDIPDDFRGYVRGWIDGEFSMFRPSVRTECVNHRQAFSGLKEAS
jgi:hypothetical protein